MYELQDWQELLAKTASDSLSGARSITIDAVSVMVAYGRQSKPASFEELRFDLRYIIGTMLHAHPSMASVINLFNNIWTAVEIHSTDVAAALADVCDVAARYTQSIGQRLASVSEQAAAIVPADALVLTLSASSTVAEALIQAHSDGKNPRVICLEARPMLEGQAIASRLARAGINVEFMIDIAAYDALRKVDIVLVGADSFTSCGVLSKLGTGWLAHSAQMLNVPTYALADTSKIWPAALGTPAIVSHDAGEVWPDAPKNVTVHNRYFDVADWGSFQGAVTELGVMNSREIIMLGTEIHVHSEVSAIYENIRRADNER